MLIFGGKVNGKFFALPRPLGSLYFAYPPGSGFEAGPSINLSSSPDALQRKPSDFSLIRPQRGSTSVAKVGGGSDPILTDRGWLLLYHGVQPGTVVGTYRTFHAFLDAKEHSRAASFDDSEPVLESQPGVTESIKDLAYLTGNVFSTGIVDDRDHFIVASGEDDLECRITRIPKSRSDCSTLARIALTTRPPLRVDQRVGAGFDPQIFHRIALIDGLQFQRREIYALPFRNECCDLG